MTQDNSYSFNEFAAIGGFDHDGESFSSLRIFGRFADALHYARELVNGDFSYDYAYVAGVYPNGSMELKDVTRVADDEPSVINLG